MFMLLIACSKSKVKEESALASEMYTGALHVKARTLAEKWEVPYCILSAKYKWVWPTLTIDNYNERFYKKFEGPWPPDDCYGYYVGGAMYFDNAPERFQRLIPKLPQGKMLKALNELLNDDGKTKELLKSHPLHGSLPA